MSDFSDNVLPETMPLVAAARSIPGRERWQSPVRNMAELWRERATSAPNRRFLTFYADGSRREAYTYSEFHHLALQAASLFMDVAGLRPGDRVATLMANHPRTIAAYFGAWLAGLTVVPINCGEDDERVAFILQNSEVRAVVAAPEQAARAAALRPSAGGVRWWAATGTETAGLEPFDALLAAQDAATDLPDVGADAEALIVYTSGTTGAPKGVVLEQYNLFADADSIARWHGFGPDDVAMNVLPIHHVNGTVVTLMTPLWSHGGVVVNDRLRAHAFFGTLAAEGCTWTSVVPTVLAFLCEAAKDLSEVDLTRFRHIICGAGPLSVELARKFEAAYGLRVVHGYGLSETTCYSCFLPVDLDDATHRYWMQECGFPSIGCPIDANEMAIHDPDGNALPPDTRGEIVARGFNVMRWYFKRPEVNRDTFAHGWFRSGDEGFRRQGPDGRDYYFITGRLKELIIRGGINYSPFDIDEVLCAIPGVRAGMAVGFDNEFYGEEVGAYVQREPGSSVTDVAIIAACRAQMPFSKCPKVVLFGEDFPVTSTGKYQRSKLKPLFEAWRRTQFREPR